MSSNPTQQPRGLLSRSYYGSISDPRAAYAILDEFGVNQSTEPLLLVLTDDEAARYLSRSPPIIHDLMPLIGPKTLVTWLNKSKLYGLVAVLNTKWSLASYLSALLDADTVKLRYLLFNHKVPDDNNKELFQVLRDVRFSNLVRFFTLPTATTIGHHQLYREFELAMVDLTPSIPLTNWHKYPRGNLTLNQEVAVLSRQFVYAPSSILFTIQGYTSVWFVAKLLSFALRETGPEDRTENYKWRLSLLGRYFQEVHRELSVIIKNPTQPPSSIYEVPPLPLTSLTALAVTLDDPSFLTNAKELSAEIYYEQNLTISGFAIFDFANLFARHNLISDLPLGVPTIMISELLKRDNFAAIAPFTQVVDLPDIAINRTNEARYLLTKFPNWCNGKRFHVPFLLSIFEEFYNCGRIKQLVVNNPATISQLQLFVKWYSQVVTTPAEQSQNAEIINSLCRFIETADPSATANIVFN
jgi:hypothetical protein